MLRSLKKRGVLALKVTYSLMDEDGIYRPLRAEHLYVKGILNQGRLLGVIEEMKRSVK